MRKFILFLLTSLILVSCFKEKKSTTGIQEMVKIKTQTVPRDSTLDLSKEIESLIADHEGKSGAYILEDGGSSLVSRAWLTEYAQKSIDIQYFIFSTDNVGLIACDYLVRAADRGVKVRILIDDVMVEAGESDLFTLDAHENISIKIFNPGLNVGKNIFSKLAKLSTDFVKANRRMHNKTFTIDGKVVITGGRNIADEYFDYDHEYNFRDRDVMLLGEVTNNVNQSFNTFWDDKLSVHVSNLIDKEDVALKDSSLYASLHDYASNPENFWPEIHERIDRFDNEFRAINKEGKMIWTDKINFISDLPEKNDTDEIDGGGTTTDTLLSLLKSAKTTIDIQTPYLVTTELSRSLFKEIVDKGIKVRILTNSLGSTDNIEAFSGYQRDREELLATGIEVYEFKPDAKSRYDIMTSALQKKLNYAPVFGLHAKTMVVDGKISVIGTFNLDPRSANLNTECITVMDSEEISSSILEGIETEFNAENAWRITPDFNPDHLVNNTKRFKTWTRKVVPKGIL